jgi:carbonic anhydrase
MNQLIIPPDFNYRGSAQASPFAWQSAESSPPEAVIVTCSDGALDEPLACHFDRRPVLLLRTVGNAVLRFSDRSAEFTGALEDAVVRLRAPQIIICGHSNCRAFRTNGTARPLSSPPATSFEAMQDRMAQANASTALAKRHAIEQSEALRTYPFVEAGIAEQRLRLSTLFYLHESGLFLYYDERQKDFSPLVRP